MSTFCSFFVLRFAISQAGIPARALTLMQDSEEKEKPNAARIAPERETWQARILTTLRCPFDKVLYLTRVKDKKAIDG